MPKEKPVDKFGEIKGAEQSKRLGFVRDSEFFGKSPKSKTRIKWLITDKLQSAQEHFQIACLHELETGTGFNLFPVFLSVGIATYFAVPSEPSFFALEITFLFLCLVVSRTQVHGKAYFGFIIASAVVCGMLASKFAVMINHTNIIERQITANISGIVINVDQNRRGSPRYIIAPDKIEGLSPHELPRFLRISAASKHEKINASQSISGLARLQPISGPIYPNGYDFSFFSWFEGMGGSGFFMGAPRRIQEELSSPWKHEVIFEINQLRAFIERRIKTALPDANGDIAVALVTGNKTGISEEIQQTLRVTGLAHILAISGFHMALVTLTVIWLVRGILARFSQLALHYPIKKIAVGAGFFSATFYLLISGGGVATKRAWIMISVMLLAALMDRRAITMRSVAISALFILLLSPQSLLSPGFQMSFAAVASLVAGYEILNKRRKDKNENLIIASKQPHWLIGSFKQILSYFVGIAVTSLIAGTATGFIAAWHFNQIAPLGLIANVLAMPIITIVVMPFVLASVLLMPYGLEYFALIPVAYGIEQVIAIATTIQSYSPAVPIHGLPHISLILFATFLTVLTVLKSKLRYTSLFLLPFIYYTWEKPEIPDIAIAENGRALAVKDEGGNLALLNTRRGSFVTDIWAKNWTQDGFAKIEVDEKSCNRERCVHTLPNNKKLHLVYNPDLLQSSCQTADILLAPRLWWVNCKAHKPELILKRYDFEQFGMHAIYFTSEATKPYRIETGLSKSQRPWQRTVRPIDEVRGNTPWRASGTDE